MPIGIVTMLGVYVICWWTVLFTVLRCTSPRPTGRSGARLRSRI